MALLSPSVAFNSSAGVPRAHPAAGNPTNPIVFFDINIGGSNAGRIVMEVNYPAILHSPPLLATANSHGSLLACGCLTCCCVVLLHQLFADVVPKTTENFRQFCTGEFRSVAPTKPLHRLHYSHIPSRRPRD